MIVAAEATFLGACYWDHLFQPNFTTGIGAEKALTIKRIDTNSMGNLVVDVQDVASSQIKFSTQDCLYVNGTNQPFSVSINGVPEPANASTFALKPGETATLTSKAFMPLNNTYAVRVVDEDGQFTETTTAQVITRVG